MPYRFALAQPAFLEVGLRIRVPVRLGGIALTALTGADLLTFPSSIGERGISVLALSDVVEQLLLLILDEESIDHRVDARHATRDRHRVLGFIIGVHPARQLDDAVTDRA